MLPHEPTEKTRQQVEAMAAFGLKHDHIARIVGISDETLRKYYRNELDLGLSKVTAQVANSLYKRALSDRSEAVAAAKFFLQSQAGWKERAETEHSGEIRTIGEVMVRGVRPDTDH